MANADTKIPKVKQTCEILIQTHKNETVTRFEVLTKLMDVQILIGKDLIKALSLDIFGLPYKYANEKMFQPDLTEKKQKLIEETNTCHYWVVLPRFLLCNYSIQ
ncbi:hypothetical protein AYI70_g1166 [Smittium culicis]|uniref:Uncharacterized protein n=1 Tax=Smittium culicis TaxID=133412 RepID=A0A1R1YDR4_9FUNG|nr:hypothetical protein AYI70_g1166 [Smittium culicis]